MIADAAIPTSACSAKSVVKSKTCKDCGAGNRPAPFPGPRCATHHKDKKKADKEAAWAKHLLKTYGLTVEQYWEIYERQGGKCYICQFATGASRKLAVDHDHKSGYVRGLLCSSDNKLIGRFKDDPEAFARGAFYLRQPPAYRWIGRVKPSE